MTYTPTKKCIKCGIDHIHQKFLTVTDGIIMGNVCQDCRMLSLYPEAYDIKTNKVDYDIIKRNRNV